MERQLSNTGDADARAVEHVAEDRIAAGETVSRDRKDMADGHLTCTIPPPANVPGAHDGLIATLVLSLNRRLFANQSSGTPGQGDI
jgi:hypothetical protein